MKIGVLYSGGKDSNLALIKALEKNYNVSCLLNLIPFNKESYMFQSINVELTKLQSVCLDIPIIQHKTKGEKERELEDLKKLLEKGIKKYGIEGVVVGAIKSTYQNIRVQKVAHELGLWVFAPLWLIDEKRELKELEKYKFKAVITKISSFPLTSDILGKNLLDIKDFLIKNEKFINISGEGGEYETFVLDNLFFKKRIEIIKKEKIVEGENYGLLVIKKAKVVKK